MMWLCQNIKGYDKMKCANMHLSTNKNKKSTLQMEIYLVI